MGRTCKGYLQNILQKTGIVNKCKSAYLQKFGMVFRKIKKNKAKMKATQ